MITNRKGRAGWHQATPKRFKFTWKFTELALRFKAAIVTLAMWMLLIVTVAVWIACRGGLCNV